MSNKVSWQTSGVFMRHIRLDLHVFIKDSHVYTSAYPWGWTNISSLLTYLQRSSLEFVETFTASVYLVTCTLFNFLYYQHSLLSSWTMCVTSPPGHKNTTGWLYFDCRIGTVLFIYNVYNGSWHVHWFEETLIYQFFIGHILKNDRLSDKDTLGQWLQENFFVIAGKTQVKLTLLTMAQFHKYPNEPTCTIPGVWGWAVVFLLWHQNAGW